MPLTDLCSRLVVTSTRWNTLLPSLGLSPCRPPRPASPFRPSLRPSFQNAAVHGDADRPLPACSTLGGDAVDAAPPAAAILTAPQGCSVSRTACSQGHCPPRTRPVSWLAGTPCRSRAPFPASRARLPEARTFVTRRPPRLHTRRRPEAPSADKSQWPRIGLAPATRPLGPPLVPRLGRRCPASDMRSRPASPNARPRARAGFHRSAWATCRLSTSTAVCPPSTPKSCRNPTSRCDGKPPRSRW